VKHPYYIKMVYGRKRKDVADRGRDWREGGEHYLHFAEEQRTLGNRFADATGFLVYETGQEDGARTIFGSGTILSLRCEDLHTDPARDETGKIYPWGIKVSFDKLVPPKQGISLEEVYRLCPRLTNHFKQAMGGLIGITTEEFTALSNVLDAR